MKAQTMRRVRQVHFYLGMVFAPAILLFAISGALQTFRLQEAKGYGGTPPGWIVWMASVHKDQSLPREKRATAPTTKTTIAPAKPSERDSDRPAERVSPLPLKIFVAIMSLGLLASALLGIVIALTNRSMRRMSCVMLAIGTVLPIALLLI